MYLSSGRGRKSGGARATGATPSLAPLSISELAKQLSMIEYKDFNILYSKMCSIRNSDFGNQFSVFGLYVMPTHF